MAFIVVTYLVMLDDVDPFRRSSQVKLVRIAPSDDEQAAASRSGSISSPLPSRVRPMPMPLAIMMLVPWCFPRFGAALPAVSHFCATV